MPWTLILTIIGALAVAWLALVLALVAGRPRNVTLSDAMRVLPDLLRLLRRLAADPALPRGVRLRLGALLVYLAIPIDLIPDVIPVLGYADDLIIATLVLRSVVKHAGMGVVRANWPGGDASLEALCRLCGLSSTAPGRGQRMPPRTGQA